MPGIGRRLGRTLLLGVLSSGLACGSSADTQGPNPPNIVLITADDLGWRDLGSYGNDQGATPHLDRLASEGLRFTRAFVTTPSCSSSRATLATGQYPHTNGVTGLVHRFPERSLPAGTATLASLLRDAGYRTAIQGKWHLSFQDAPQALGYEEQLSDFVEQVLWTDLDPLRSVDFMRRNRDRPFYLEINSRHNHRAVGGDFFFDPRFPVDADRIEVPAYWHLPQWPEIRDEVARFFSQTQRLDQIVGEVLRALDDLDLTRDTLVVFVSDNGPPFPGMKLTLYDRGTGTPLLVRWRGRVPAGALAEQLTSTVDLMPTLLAAAGVPVPASVEGRSLLGLIRDASRAAPRDAVFTEMTDHVLPVPMRAIRTDEWKYILNLSEHAIGLDEVADEDWARRLVELADQPWTQPRPREELYRISSDALEQRNLAHDPGAQAVREELRVRLRAHMVATQDPLLGTAFP